MTPERWSEIERLYHAARERPPASRPSFLREACPDSSLRHEVESLLRDPSSAGAFLEQSGLAAAAQMIDTASPMGPMSLRISGYDVGPLLGAGGMGEVYRARDLRLERDVAVKILPHAFANDTDRLARFEREARILAALNHENIAAIHGIVEARLIGPDEATHDVHALVLELVDGQTLAERLERGPLPLTEALAIARQVTAALEAAHEKGIVHRDLKPANIQVTRDGLVKLLDFGLARAAPGGVVGEAAPALIESLHGLVLGTVAYMSPEQARGKTVDRRTDVWAFGCVLYEMLTGVQIFRGETVSDVLSAVLNAEPDWAALPTQTPSSIRRLLNRCLQKDPARRLHDLADARIEIDEAPNEIAERPTARALTLSVRSVAALSLALAGFTGLGFYVGQSLDENAERRVEINVPPTTTFASFAVSPDGRTLVFVATSDGLRRLWLRPLDSVDAQPIRGTEGANLPFWSPTNQSIGFFADGKLKRIDVNGGSPQTLANATVASGGSWNQNGVIVFSPAPGVPLSRVSERGGETMPVTQLVSPQVTHNQPSFLPDNSHFLLFVEGDPEINGVYLGSLESPEIRRLFAADAPAVFMSPDQIVFIQEGTLFARRLDMRSLEPTGEPVPVARRVAAVSATGAGVVAYRTTPERQELAQLNWLDRTGRPVARLGALQSLSPELSPDGAFIAMHRQVGGNIDVWLVDATTGGAPIRLTTGPAVEGFPIWSPDATRILFRSNRFELRVKPANGMRRDEAFWESTKAVMPLDWSPDGRYILVRQHESGETMGDVYAIPLGANGTPEGAPFPVANSTFDERDGRFSPDGRWVAYQSNESGRFEIYLQPFPGPGPKVPVSSDGGVHVRWPRQSQELFYIGLDGKVMTVPVIRSTTGGGLKTGAPSVLFQTNLRAATNREQLRQEFDVSPDGRRVLMGDVAEWTMPILLILNWRPPVQ